ncbi:hypothetical protein QBC37DRAFT_128598, partial [Rhypophila decipiens]
THKILNRPRRLGNENDNVTFFFLLILAELTANMPFLFLNFTPLTNEQKVLFRNGIIVGLCAGASFLVHDYNMGRQIYSPFSPLRILPRQVFNLGLATVAGGVMLRTFSPEKSATLRSELKKAEVWVIGAAIGLCCLEYLVDGWRWLMPAGGGFGLDFFGAGLDFDPSVSVDHFTTVEVFRVPRHMML